MKHLTKKQIEDIESHRAKLEDARRIIEEAISKAQAIVDEAIEEVNGWREDAVESIREIYGKTEDFFDERSDNWKDGDAGSSYMEWMGAIDEAATTLEDELSIDIAALASDELDAIEQWSGILEEIPHAPDEV